MGEIEDNNPLLVISVPEKLQANENLMQNLEANSEILLSHFDLHLTWMDIASIAPISSFTDFSLYNWTEFTSVVSAFMHVFQRMPYLKPFLKHLYSFLWFVISLHVLQGGKKTSISMMSDCACLDVFYHPVCTLSFRIGDPAC